MSKTTTQKTNENSSQQSPAYVQDAAKYALNAGQNMTSPFLQMGQNALAGFTPDQLAGFDMARNIASQRNDNTYKWFQGARDYVGDATYRPPGAADIAAFQNPFQQQAIDNTVATINRDWRDRDASLAAGSAASAVRGSGGAIARGQLARGAGETVANTTAQMNQQGYSQALQAALQNASAAAASEDTRRARGMQGLQMGSELETQDLQRQLLGLQTLLSSGDAQQGQVQRSLDVPWTMLQLLSGMTPQDQSMTSQSQKKTESSGGGNAISGLAGLASIAKSFGFIGCDRSLKTDIEEIGVDEASGLMIYAFRYKADPKTYPKTIGPMADEVEAKFPGSTRVIAGKRVIMAA